MSRGVVARSMVRCAALVLAAAAVSSALRRDDADYDEELNDEININKSETELYFGKTKAEELLATETTECPIMVDNAHPLGFLNHILSKRVGLSADSGLFRPEHLNEALNNNIPYLLQQNQGAAPRAEFESSVRGTAIPAGLNLGGNCLVQLDEYNTIFFHRMKLRNNTHFSIVNINNDITDGSLHAKLVLHDLHLEGSYERTKADPGGDVVNLYYQPAFGVAEFLLQDVVYLVEGKYRMLGKQLTLEMIKSELKFKDTLVTYKNKEGNSVPVQVDAEKIDEFIQRMKVDLDDWLKDFINDVISYSSSINRLLGQPKVQEIFRKQDKIRISLNHVVDAYIEQLGSRQHARQNESQAVPDYTIHSVVGTRVELYKGTLVGLDSMYRRSAVTTFFYNNDNDPVSSMDVVVGFSDLTLIYGANLFLPSFGSSKGNRIILTLKDVTAHLEVLLHKDPRKVKVTVSFLRQLKPELLTLDGPISRDIANFKHLLQLEITTLMLNTIVANINNLGSLTSCGPGAEKVEYDPNKEDPDTVPDDPEDPDVPDPDNNDIPDGLDQEYLSDPDQPGPDNPANPDYPGPDDTANPDYPGPNDPANPDYPGQNDPANPDYPGPNDPANPDYPGQNDTANPDYPGQNDPANPDYPGPDDTANPDYPGPNDPANPDYPGPNDQDEPGTEPNVANPDEDGAELAGDDPPDGTEVAATDTEEDKNQVLNNGNQNLREFIDNDYITDGSNEGYLERRRFRKRIFSKIR